VSAQADDEDDVERRTALLHLAVKYCKKSDTYCRHYQLGQNSIGSSIRLVSLYTRLGDFSNAKSLADAAFKEAKNKDNIAEAALAHGHRVRLLLWKKDFAEAEKLHSAFLKLVKDASLHAVVDEGYREMLKQARKEPGCLPQTRRIA
jgi:tetratricopeptide (TPR) repeat protein